MTPCETRPFEHAVREARASWVRKFPALEAAFRKRGFEHFECVDMDGGRAEHAFATRTAAVLFHVFAGNENFIRQCRELLIVRNALLRTEEGATILLVIYAGKARTGLRAPNGVRLMGESDLSDIWDFICQNEKEETHNEE